MEIDIETGDITRPEKEHHAPGKPGSAPVWSSGAKTIVGTAASPRSRVWYTVGEGTLNEIYFADVEQANTRSVRFLVSDGNGYFADDARDAEHLTTSSAGEPWCRIESRCKSGRYALVKEILTDPVHDTVLVQVHFRALGDEPLKLYVTIDPHIGDRGAGNNAWIGKYKNRTMLVAQRDSLALAGACTAPITHASCGYCGKSDGYTLLSKHKPLPKYNFADEGNVDLTAEIDHAAVGGVFTFVIGFGTTPPEAAQEATTGVLQDFDTVRANFVQQWREEQSTYLPMEDLSGHALDLYRVSTAVLETHQSKRFPGGFIASLSIPWGFACSDEDAIGYHVLWPRDMVQTAMGKLACGDARAARSTLFFLRCTQEESGGWSQNIFLDGTPYWKAIQMDGTALPILLADALRRADALDGYDATAMVESAVRFLLKYGPWTEQDRWEALPGYSPYSSATQVAALLAAADFVEAAGDRTRAEFLRETADAWHDTIDEFTYVTGTDLAVEHGVAGYYIRMAPPRRVQQKELGNLLHKMSNLPFGQRHQRAADIVSPDALALVRFGLRAADDPRIVNTLRVLDATLKRDTSTGPTWTRSTKDGYGEDDAGAPYKGTGAGRGWPLLTGERAHYELAAGNRAYALELLKTIARQTSSGGMIPEQVWDAADIPERSLYNGHPSGSGMPLVWAHSEYIKLLRSLHEDRVWDLPPQTVQRYLGKQRVAPFQIWTVQQKRAWLAEGKDLRFDLPSAATLSWKAGKSSGELHTADTGFGTHCATLRHGDMGAAKRLHIRLEPEDPNDKQLKAETTRVSRHPQ